MINRITVMSRWRVPSFECNAHHAIISIGDPRDEPAKIPKRWGQHSICRVQFRDVNTSKFDGMLPRHAKQIWLFLRGLPDYVTALVIHCEAGASRSPSVAMAICDEMKLGRVILDWMNGDKFADAPNTHVYNVMLRVARVRLVEVGNNTNGESI